VLEFRVSTMSVAEVTY